MSDNYTVAYPFWKIGMYAKAREVDGEMLLSVTDIEEIIRKVIRAQKIKCADSIKDMNLTLSSNGMIQ